MSTHFVLAKLQQRESAPLITFNFSEKTVNADLHVYISYLIAAS